MQETPAKRRRNVDPAVAQCRAKIGADTRWALEPDRRAATEPARRAYLGKFAEQIREKFPDLPDHEIERRAASLRSAHFARLALKSVQARRARKGKEAAA